MRTSGTAIVGAAALLGSSLERVEPAAVVIEGSRIAAAGPVDEVAIPEAARREPAHGLVLFPGFIDAHVHIALADPAAVLAGGVTTVRDLGWPEAEIFELARASAEERVRGPLVVATGPILTAPGGYPTRAAWAPPGTGVAVAPENAVATVDSLAARGAAAIKVALNPPAGPVLDAPTLGAIVRAAHARGLRVTAHVHDVAQLRKALAAGVDELAHMLLSGETIPDPLIAAMVDRAMTVVPTLAIFWGRARRAAIDNLRAFVAAGGRVVYGTDLGNEGPRPGIDGREVAGMLEAGMSPRAVLTSATVDAAFTIRQPYKGALAAGMDADVVAFAGDPLDDPDAFTRVARVWRAGARV